MNTLRKIDIANPAALAAALSTDTFRQIAAIFAQNEAKEARLETDLLWFIQGVKEKGYSSTDEFLTLAKVIKPVATIGTRSRMVSVKRTAVEAAVKAQTKSPDEIASEFGITPAFVYRIRWQLGLTVKRKPKQTLSAPPTVRRHCLKYVDFPEHFTVDELATHLRATRPAAHYKVKKGLKCGAIKLIGKKPYGRCVYQRMDAKYPLVLERFKNTVVLSPAVANEIKESMTHLSAAA